MTVSDLRLPMARVAQFCRHHRIRQLALFGSALRTDFRPDSDIDLLVEFEPGAQVGLFALLGMQEELSAILQRPVDLVPRLGLKPMIRDSVLASAQVLYAA
jgi:predicted nucleotidyltransferase